MPASFPQTGKIQLFRGTTKLGDFNSETSAVAAALNDWETFPVKSRYTLKYPDKEINLSTLSRIIFDPDNLAPTAPVITATATGQTSMVVALTFPATDVQSGIATYRLEYKRNVDSSWTLDSALLTAGSFPRTISGLTAGTLYDTRCRATDGSSNVGPFSVTSSTTTQAGGTPPGLVLNVATEPSNGTDGACQWQSAFLGNDGRIFVWGTGNHVFEQSNSMRCIDPVTTPGSVLSYDIFPHTQSGGNNLYVSNHDNHPTTYIPSENKGIWFGHGVFDFDDGVESWVYGDRSPNTQTVANFIDMSAHPNFGGVYNPANAWCSALDMGAFYGVDGGGNGNPVNACLTTLERNSAGNWRLVVTSMTGQSMANVCDQRNSAVCVGPFMYMQGTIANESGVPTGGLVHYKVDLRTKTRVATLAACPDIGGFPQWVYDSARNKIVALGNAVYEYDFTTNAWTNVTPSNYPAIVHHVRGVYHPTLNAIYFTGTGASFDAPVNFKWHKLTFAATGSFYRAITTDTNANPFQGPPEESFGGSKHVWMTWAPTKNRVYTFGGDYGNGAGQYTFNYGAGAVSEPNMGSSFTTFAPSGARSYARDSSLCNDMYSIDPHATGTLQWRLEHPYKVRNMGGGVREVRPGRPDQSSLVWDPVRSKFWAIYTVLRTEFLYYEADGTTPDLWANGDTTTTGVKEPIGTYSWVPGASGAPGTFTLETTNRLSYRSGGTSYNGGQLISGLGDERIGLFQYEPKNDVIACLSAAVGSTQALFTFHPATKTYEYRTFSASGYSRMDCSCSQCDFVDGWAYAVALATTSGGTRKSVLLRVNVTAALAVANQGTIPQSAIEVIDLPWSLSPGNVWENAGNASAKWQEHCGVVAVDRKIALVKSYDGISEDGTTKLAVWNPDSRTFSAGALAPEAIVANSWCLLPTTGEVLFGMNTSGVYSNLKMWAYRVR
jgi:hypothetical protein